MRVKFSCYYVHTMVPKSGSPKGKVHRSKRWGTYSDKATVIVHVDPKDHMMASIEASASLKIEGALGLAYVRKGLWKLKPEAPYGIGCRGQPLVPKRDFAQGHTGSFTWPFGTRLDVISKPDDLPMNNVLYCADRFGKMATAVRQKKAYRIDCFTGIPHQDVDWMEVKVRKPWTGPDGDARWWQLGRKRSRKNFRRPVCGGQMCLNIIGVDGKNGKPLDEDGRFGKQSRHAVETWFSSFASLGLDDGHGLFDPKNLPERMHPTDPAIYWALREHAKRISKDSGVG